MADLSVKVAGVEFKNPVMVASGYASDSHALSGGTAALTATPISIKHNEIANIIFFILRR
mgnify:CR=1 FL=1